LPVSAVDVIGPAFRHAKEQLLAPFRLGQWVRLAVVGLLAGEMTSGGCNFNPGIPGDSGRSSENFVQAMPELVVMAGLITLLIAVVIVLWLVFTYINSMMRFILFDSVIARECRIRRFWKQRRAEGFRYFVWQIGFTLVMLAAILLVVGVPLLLAYSMGVFVDPGNNLPVIILGAATFGLLLAILVIAALVVFVLTKDFVVPQMACEGVTALEGWRRLWPMIHSEKGGYTVYILLKIALSIAAGVAVFIVMLAILLVLLIPVGGFGVFAFLVGRAVGLEWNVFTIAAVAVAGIVVFAVILFLGAMISVPAIVFFPAYSIYFFAARYPALDALLHPVPPEPLGGDAPAGSPI
jgi:hypothetical protein